MCHLRACLAKGLALHPPPPPSPPKPPSPPTIPFIASSIFWLREPLSEIWLLEVNLRYEPEACQNWSPPLSIWLTFTPFNFNTPTPFSYKAPPLSIINSWYDVLRCIYTYVLNKQSCVEGHSPSKILFGRNLINNTGWDRECPDLTIAERLSPVCRSSPMVNRQRIHSTWSVTI